MYRTTDVLPRDENLRLSLITTESKHTRSNLAGRKKKKNHMVNSDSMIWFFHRRKRETLNIYGTFTCTTPLNMRVPYLTQKIKCNV